ncbi:unnamed protein product [Orchesella dallaii]|uniref:Uncharacterized protein n=1 Tax=Orchesella dallaii TaxID=48710 RepID=A0ABP1R503_9HEXA
MKRILLLWATPSALIFTLLIKSIFGDKIWENFDDKSAIFTEYRRFYSNYQDPKLKYLNDVFISDFGEYLQLYSRCLVHIINYNGIDIPSSDQPLMLSRYDVIKVEYEVEPRHSPIRNYTYHHPNHNYNQERQRQPKISRRVRMIPIEKVPKPHEELSWCKRHWPEVECLDIPYLDLTTRMRWTCEAHIYLIPPNAINSQFYEFDSYRNQFQLIIPAAYKKFGYHKINPEENEYESNKKLLYIVNSRARYEVLVNSENEFQRWAWSNRLTKIDNLYGVDEIFVTSRRELLFTPIQLINEIEIGSKGSNSKLALQSPHARTSDTSLLCRHCVKCQPLYRIWIGKPSGLDQIDAIFSFLNSKTDNIIWRITGVGGLINIYHENSWSLPPAGEAYKKINSIIRKHMISSDLERLRWEMEIRVFRDIIRNASAVGWPYCSSIYDVDAQCDCGDAVHFHPLVKLFTCGNMDHAEGFIHETNLKFVSCGSPHFHSWAFNQLFVIFDEYTWGCIVLMILVISTVSTMILIVNFENPFDFKEENVMEYWIRSVLSYSKGLLDQGDPIFIRLAKIPKLRGLFGCFLLMAIVLPNAYKHTNITKLTLPPAPIPYDTFSKLVESKFDIYTKATYIAGIQETSFDQLHPLHRAFFQFTFVNLAKPSQNHGQHDISNAYQSQVFAFAQAEVKYNEVFDFGTETHLNLSKTALDLINHTKLHPLWFEKLVGSGLISNYDLIKNCTKIALMLPEIEANLLYYKFRNLGISNAFRSKESLLSHSYGIRFLHWVSPIVLERVKAIRVSGILKRWDDLVTKYFTKIQNSKVNALQLQDSVPKAIKISSNVVVVFFVLIGGTILAVVAFLVETMIGRRNKVHKQNENNAGASYSADKVDKMKTLGVRSCTVV